MAEMVEFAEKYKTIYTPERANKVTKEIQDLRYSVDSQERTAIIVQAEKSLITVSLVAYKKYLQWNLVMQRQFPSNRMMPGLVQHLEDILKIVDETAYNYNLDLSTLL